MDYLLKPLGKICAATGQPLQPGSQCHSILIEQNGEQVRLDFSDAGWNGVPPNALGYWRIKIPESANPQQIKLDPEVIFNYFEQLSLEASPIHDRIRYVMALFLLQKKRLQLDGSHDDGGCDVLELSGTHGEGQFEVRNLNLPADELEQLQFELKSQMAAGNA